MIRYFLLFAVVFANASGFQTGKLSAKSLSSLAVGPNGVLFVGDSLGTCVYALDLEDTKPHTQTTEFSFNNLEEKLGAMLGIDAADVLIHDMAVNPISKNIYLTVGKGRRNWSGAWQLPNHVDAANLLIRITPEAKISEVNLDSVKFATANLPNASVSENLIEWLNAKERVDAISYMAYKEGKLYVAGLSNEAFSSSLWVIPYPFGEAASLSSVEIFHGAHGRYETNSPIRAFLPYEVGGKPELLAAYLCTPLVKIPLEALKDKAHIKGTTIGELGMGSYPLDFIQVKENGKDMILMANNRRGMLKFDPQVLNEFKGSISTNADTGEGVAYKHLRDYGAQQLSYYNEDFALMMVRQPSGSLDLMALNLSRLN